MLLDLTRYRQPTTQFARTFKPSELAAEGETYEVREPVDLSFEVQKDKSRFRLVGRLRTVLQLPCSRCLEGYPFPVDATFDLRYLPVEEAGADSESEVAEDDLDTSYYRDDQIDLAELMREQFYLALPMKPLCRADCKGLCPQCGTNLNGGLCSCDTHVDDPRLEALKALQTRRES